MIDALPFEVDASTAAVGALVAFVVYQMYSNRAEDGDGSGGLPSIPTKQDVLKYALVNRKFVFLLFSAACAYLYMGAGLPESQSGVVFYGYLTAVATYFPSQKAFGMLDFSTSKILRPVDPRDDVHRHPWKIPDEWYADLTIIGAETLQPQRSPWGTVYNVLMYDPERNLCVAAPDAAADPEELAADRSKIQEIYDDLCNVARKYQVFLRVYPSLLLKDVKEVEEEVGRATQKGMFPSSTRDGKSIDDELAKIALDEEERDDEDADEISEVLDDLDGDRAKEVLSEMTKEVQNGHGE